MEYLDIVLKGHTETSKISSVNTQKLFYYSVSSFSS